MVSWVCSERQQQQLRVLHQQHADLQELLLAVGQQPGLTLRRAAQANGLEHLGNAVFLLAAEGGAQAGPH